MATEVAGEDTVSLLRHRQQNLSYGPGLPAPAREAGTERGHPRGMGEGGLRPQAAGAVGSLPLF